MLKLGRTSTGYRIAMEGKGTFRESEGVERFVQAAKAGGAFTLNLDLSACEYLDSTFLGCIVGLQRGSSGGSPAFAVVNPSAACQKLFKDLHVTKILTIIPEGLPVVGEMQTVPPEQLEPEHLARHMMECHRRLADLGGPMEPAFTKIADRFQRELESKKQ